MSGASEGVMADEYIETEEALRTLYQSPSDRALRKQLMALDRHCRRFIELSPFLVIATTGESGIDASPRGGDAGFVRVVDEKTLWIPDSPGNNRLDSLANILQCDRVGVIFMIPGVDETLRVNGAARLTAAANKLDQFADANRKPKLLIEITVKEAYLHCAKALMRSRLWSPEAQCDRSVLPTLGVMLSEQLGLSTTPETQEQMLERYKRDL
jgi:uncharacterized protein